MHITLKKSWLYMAILLLPAMAVCQSNFDEQIRKMSETLSSRLLKSGKKRVAVSNFTDLQGNATELGKYIAEVFSIELSNTELEIVDRSRLKDLLTELKLTEEKLTNPANALKLGEMAGVEFIVTGVTTPLDKTVDITVKALDIQKGISIGGQRGSVPRTDAINNLMRSTIGGSAKGGVVTPGANVNMAKTIETSDRSPLDDLFEAKISDLRKSQCYNASNKTYFGQICFENQTGEDLVFSTYGAWGWPGFYGLNAERTVIPNGTRNCSPLICVNYPNTEGESTEIKFIFRTYDSDKLKQGSIKLIVEKCKVKSIVLTRQNLVLLP